MLSGSLNLGAWTSGSTLYLLWVDDNGPRLDVGFTLDNVSFTPFGRSLIYNLSHAAGGAPNGTFTTAGGNYWLDSATPAAAVTNDLVAFSQTGTASINVPVGGVTAGGMTVNNSSGTYTIGGAGAITTTLGLTKANAGTLVLTSANAFPSRTLTGGTVETQVTGALGTAGTIVLSGAATLKTTTVAQTFGGQISTGTGGAASVTNVDTALGTGTSTVNANARVNFNASQTLAALTIADGVEVTFGNGLPFAGEGTKAWRLARAWPWFPSPVRRRCSSSAHSDFYPGGSGTLR